MEKASGVIIDGSGQKTFISYFTWKRWLETS